ncbi:DUF222 domain-containing protein [Marisediminicola antarctica]|uniref:HNH nuclease domain-containing protein n=1 Tax=Marisediminicola antarctica TaxID=674079 RepID=A0A7L5AET7_9MICO|nr:DUF222 domain-containing protein [Marisediminicola antarctica]QHO68933.1 hypothetical protein BHD05_04050 [Marisediminicola antarctica]
MDEPSLSPPQTLPESLSEPLTQSPSESLVEPLTRSPLDPPSESLSSSLRESAARVASLGDHSCALRCLTSADLLAAQSAITTLRRCVDRYAAMAAGEIAHRSTPEHGHSGLAQKAGFVSPEAMLQSIANISRIEAVKLMRVGSFIAESEAAAELAASAASLDDTDGAGVEPGTGGPDAGLDGTGDGTGDGNAHGHVSFLPQFPPPPPWQAPLAAALAAGILSIDAVESIRRALGDVDPAITAGALTAACEHLIGTSTGLTPEQLYRKARQLRDSLDEAGIERREKERRDLRSVRTWWDPAGMYCGSFRLPPEEGMIVSTAFDEILSPRRGGPRFVDLEAKASAEELLNDQRSTEQIAADGLVDLIRLAVDADPGTMFGRRRPAVRVMVTDQHLHVMAGHGRLEGHPDPVSFATVERHLCDTGTIAVGFDNDGQCVNVGRNQRFFTERQRIGMTLRDGGCMFAGCDRPPSYCEAHHIDEWLRDDGKTDIADGILLCRRHHLLLHNNGWQVIRVRADYYIRPPADVDPNRELIPLPSRNPEMRALKRQSDQRRAQ